MCFLIEISTDFSAQSSCGPEAGIVKKYRSAVDTGFRWGRFGERFKQALTLPLNAGPEGGASPRTRAPTPSPYSVAAFVQPTCVASASQNP